MRRALALALMLTSAPALAQDKELIVFDWSGYDFDPFTEPYFEKYGTRPTYALYANDDEAFQKIVSGFRADVAQPCSQMVSKYRDAGLIEPWDTAKIPEFAHLDPTMLESNIFKDAEGVWYIPTYWGSTALLYNKDEVPEADVASLQVFLDPKYAGRTSLPASPDDIWSLAYLATGVTDWTTISEPQFTAAADWLRAAHKNAFGYWSDPGDLAQSMMSGQVLLAWAWNDALAELKHAGANMGFQRAAKEGSSSWFCGYVNFKNGPGSEEKAYEFINNWVRPENARIVFDEFGYGTSNLEGMKAIAPDELAEAGVNPVDAPVLPQVPNDPALRERQMQELEKIKAGF